MAILIVTRLVTETARRRLLVDSKVCHECVHYLCHVLHFHADISMHRVAARRTRDHVHVHQLLLQLGEGLDDSRAHSRQFCVSIIGGYDGVSVAHLCSCCSVELVCLSVVVVVVECGGVDTNLNLRGYVCVLGQRKISAEVESGHGSEASGNLALRC